MKETKCYCGHTITCDCGPLEESKQETLEEALINNGYHDKESNDLWKEGVEFGAKWQQERSYSKEEILKMLEYAVHESRMQDDKDEDYIVNETIFEFLKQ